MKPYASGAGPKGCSARIARLSRGSVADDRQTILIANASNAMAAKHASMISRTPCLKAITTRCTWEQQQFPPMAPIFYVTMMSEQSADDLETVAKILSHVYPL